MRYGPERRQVLLEFKLENFCKVDRIVSNIWLSLKSITAEGDRYVRIGCVCNRYDILIPERREIGQLQ